MKVVQFIHQMNYSEVKGNQSYVRVDKDINKQVENIIQRGVHISFKSKSDESNLSPNGTAVTWHSNEDEIQTIGTIVKTYKVKPGDLIIFEKRENDDNIYVDCIKRANVISARRISKKVNSYEILNDTDITEKILSINVMYDEIEYSLTIKDLGDFKKRSASNKPPRPQFEITIGNKNFHDVIPNMDDFNIVNVNGQYVVERNIKNKIVEIEL